MVGLSLLLDLVIDGLNVVRSRHCARSGAGTVNQSLEAVGQFGHFDRFPLGYLTVCLCLWHVGELVEDGSCPLASASRNASRRENVVPAGCRCRAGNVTVIIQCQALSKKR